MAYPLCYHLLRRVLSGVPVKPDHRIEHIRKIAQEAIDQGEPTDWRSSLGEIVELCRPPCIFTICDCEMFVPFTPYPLICGHCFHGKHRHSQDGCHLGVTK